MENATQQTFSKDLTCSPTTFRSKGQIARVIFHNCRTPLMISVLKTIMWTEGFWSSFYSVQTVNTGFG